MSIVKPLDWAEALDESWTRYNSYVPFSYRVKKDGGWWRLSISIDGNSRHGTIYETRDEAKAAAYRDYSGRILSTLDPTAAERVKHLEEALRPFSDMAGELFARNWNASDMVVALDNPDEAHRVTAQDFFRARNLLNGGSNDPE